MRAAERCVNFSSHNQRRFSATSSWAREIGDRHEWGDKKGKLGVAKLPVVGAPSPNCHALVSIEGKL